MPNKKSNRYRRVKDSRDAKKPPVRIDVVEGILSKIHSLRNFFALQKSWDIRPNSLLSEEFQTAIASFVRNLTGRALPRSFFEPIVFTCPSGRLGGNGIVLWPVHEEIVNLVSKEVANFSTRQQSQVIMRDIFHFHESDMRMLGKLDFVLVNLNELRQDHGERGAITFQSVKEFVRKKFYPDKEYLNNASTALYGFVNGEPKSIGNAWLEKEWA